MHILMHRCFKVLKNGDGAKSMQGCEMAHQRGENTGRLRIVSERSREAHVVGKHISPHHKCLPRPGLSGAAGL